MRFVDILFVLFEKLPLDYLFFRFQTMIYLKIVLHFALAYVQIKRLLE